MMSCKLATERMSKAFDKKLPWTDKLQLFIHTRMCSDCSRCHEQLKLLHNLCQKRSESDQNS